MCVPDFVYTKDESGTLIKYCLYTKRMNFLAHAYLSFNDPGILVGNMISDFVKGQQKFDYPPRIQQGIHLHRCIDTFTDTHEATREGKLFFRPAYRLYAGAMLDVVYDHFLAADETEFSEDSLKGFAREVYGTLDTHQQWLPEKFAAMFPYMKSHNWLYGYRTREGAHRSLGGLVRRAAYLTDSSAAVAVFERHYDELKSYYQQFWADVKPYAKELLESL